MPQDNTSGNRNAAPAAGSGDAGGTPRLRFPSMAEGAAPHAYKPTVTTGPDKGASASPAHDNGLLIFDRKSGKLHVYDRARAHIKTYDATSGYASVRDETVKNKGPLPRGEYTVSARAVEDVTSEQRLHGDWGKKRVHLSPNKENQMYGRNGFFIHGGERPGSAGCIDIGDKDTELLEHIKTSGHDWTVLVN